jgi:hypothetical protein
MAAIVETIVGDKTIQLGNEEFVRKMKIGTAWGKIRVGVRWAINGTGGNIANASFLIGLCSGTTNTFYNGNTTGYFGVQFANSYPSTWINGTTNYSTGSTNGTAVYRVGASTTTSSLTWGGSQAYTGVNPLRCIWYVDYEKPASAGGIGNQGVTVWWQELTQIGSDHPQYEMWRGMETETAITGATNFNGKATTTYPGDITTLDTVSLCWNKTTPTVQISDVMVTRFY